MQVHNRYLVTESEDGLMIIDQHALHERILYEQLRERIASGDDRDRRACWCPSRSISRPAEAAAALEHRETLARLGMKIEPFGGDTVLVAGYPAMLANLDPAEVLRALVDQLLAGGKPPEPRGPAGRAAAHDRLQGGDQGRRPARPGRDHRPVGAASPGRRRPPLSPRPPHRAGLHAGGVG